MHSRRFYVVLFIFAQAAGLTGYLLLRPPSAPPIRFDVLHALSGTILSSTMAASERPLGITAVDRGTRRLWKPMYIGKARTDGQFELVWDLDISIRPDPFPDYRSQREWQRLATEQFGAMP